MKKLSVTALFLALLTLPASGQGYAETLELAGEYFGRGDTTGFEKTYVRLYPEHIKANYPPYRDALAAAKEGNSELAFALLDQLVEDDLLLDELPEENDFIALRQLPKWKELTAKIEKRVAGYNNPLRLELKDIQYRDQGIRLLYLSLRDRPEADRVHDYMKEIDRGSAAMVCAILDEYGWLGSDAIGSEANETLFLAIQHADDTVVQSRYLPILRQAVTDGNAEGWQLAFLTDRILMNQGKKQLYGTQKIISAEPGRSYLIPLEYPEKTDEMRAVLGMQPLAEELEDEGWQWSWDKYLERLPEVEKMYRQRYESMKAEK